MDKEWFADFPKLTVIPWLIWALTIGLVIGGVLYASKVSAAEPVVYADGKGNTITLSDEPCTTTEGFFSTMPDTMRGHFKAASTHWQGTDYISCWMLREDGKHFVVDETGDYGVLDGTAFKRVGADA